MNKFTEIEKSKINFLIENEVEYQIILEINKKKDEYDLPQGVWEEKSITYSEIENKIFNLIRKHGFDFKILFLWIKYYIFCNNIAGFLESLQFLLKNDKIIKQLNGEIEFYLILDYLDICLSKALNNIRLEYFEFKIIDFSKSRDTYIDNIKKLTDQEVSKIYNLYLTINQNINFFSSNYQYDLKKTKYIIDYIETAVNLYRDYLNMQSLNIEHIEEPNGIIQYKKEAMDHVEKALDILYRIDKQNISIPILEKILRWKDASLSEVLADFDDDVSLMSFLKFIKS